MINEIYFKATIIYMTTKIKPCVHVLQCQAVLLMRLVPCSMNVLKDRRESKSERERERERERDRETDRQRQRQRQTESSRQ